MDEVWQFVEEIDKEISTRNEEIKKIANDEPVHSKKGRRFGQSAVNWLFGGE